MESLFKQSLLLLLTLNSLIYFAFSEIFFEERFNVGWSSRWVLSDWKRSEGKAGTFKHTAGKWAADPDDKELKTGTEKSIDLADKKKINKILKDRKTDKVSEQMGLKEAFYL